MSSGRVSQEIAEVLLAAAAPACVSQVVIEVLIPRISRSPTTPTGAGVTQEVMEVLFAAGDPVRVTQVVLECLVLDTTPVGGGTLHETVSYGWAS